MPLQSSSVITSLGEQGWSSGGWSKLPEDLKVEILCRLPDKQLIMLKCVSKSLYSLVSNSCAPRITSTTFCGILFTEKILETGQIYLRYLFDEEYHRNRQCVPKLLGGVSRFLDSFLPFQHKPEELIGCCNGLLLMARFTSTSVPTQYCVCNPTTYESILIPINPDHVHAEDSYHTSLAFDPSDTDSPNSFKIIVPRRDLYISQHSLRIDVFSSCLSYWSSHIIHFDLALDGFNLIDHFVYLNGILYGLSLAKCLVSIYLKQHKVNSRVIYSQATALPGKDEFDRCGSIGASKGSLFYSISDNSRILVWQLQNRAQWILQYTINKNELVGHPRAFPRLQLCHNLGHLRVYAFHPNSDDIFLGTPEMVYIYNPRTKELDWWTQAPPSRSIGSGQCKVFPLQRCAVILKSVIQSQ